MKQLLIITSVPSFYKNLLLQTLSKKYVVKVFFTHNSGIKRNPDFYKYLDANLVINANNDFSFWQKMAALIKAAKQSEAIHFGGWDDWYNWVIIFFSNKKKNSVIVESSMYEFADTGLKKKLANFLKKKFLNRMATAIVSGTPHAALVKKLGFKGNIKYSFGVGILDFDYPSIAKQPVPNPCKFLLIGRMGFEKGIDLAVAAFVNMPHVQLHLVGHLEKSSFQKLPPNIVLHGYKTRSQLKSVFEQTDMLIVPSRLEPWGLVVEEALYHGLPVLVSNKVGCNEDLVEKYHAGLVFDIASPQDLLFKINEITNPTTYASLLQGIQTIPFQAIKQGYIAAFCFDE